jgi:hypothetical protein
VQHGGGPCGGLFIALEEQLRAFCALPSQSSSSVSVCAAAGPPCVPSPPPSPRAPSTAPSSSSSSSSCKGLGDLCYSFVSYEQLPQPCRDQGAGEAGLSLLQHVLCVYGPPDAKPPVPHSLALASSWVRDEASLCRLRATLECLLDQHTTVLPVKVAPEVRPSYTTPPQPSSPLPLTPFMLLSLRCLPIGLPGS